MEDKLGLLHRMSMRIALIAVNTVIVCTGTILSILGGEIDRFVTRKTPGAAAIPELWWTGIGPICIGLAGITAAATKQRRWVLVWVGAASALGLTCYCYMSVVGCLDAAQYGVALQVYGDCRQYGHKCICWREDGNAIALALSLCSDTHYVTTLYLILLVTLLLCVSSGVAATILACVATICVEYCQYKSRHSVPTTLALQSPNHLRIPGRATSMLSMSIPPSPTCMSELTVPDRYNFMSSSAEYSEY